MKRLSNYFKRAIARTESARKFFNFFKKAQKFPPGSPKREELEAEMRKHTLPDHDEIVTQVPTDVQACGCMFRTGHWFGGRLKFHPGSKALQISRMKTLAKDHHLEHPRDEKDKLISQFYLFIILFTYWFRAFSYGFRVFFVILLFD